jgi:predicted XRE-type DNA-binding protein
MTYAELLAHFGTQAQAAAAIGVTQPAISRWKARVIPPFQQLRIEALTGRRLRADKHVLPPKLGRRRRAFAGVTAA